MEGLPWPPKPDTVRVTDVGPAPRVEGRAALLLRGDKVSVCLDQLMTCAVAGLADGGSATGFMLRDDGSVIDLVTAVNLGREETGRREERFALLVSPDSEAEVAT